MQTNLLLKIGTPATVLPLLVLFLTGSLSSCVDDGKEYYHSDYGVYIEYKNDGTVAITNPIADGGVTITTEGQHVYVQSRANSVTYFLSGATENGTFRIIDSEHKQNIVLNGVSIKNTNGAALNNLSKKRTYLVIASGTENYLEDGEVLEDESKGALFCEGRLSISGQGVLNVVGNARHGIACDDDLEIHSGTINILKTMKDGLHVHDYIEVYGGTLNIWAQTDGMDCDRGYIDIYGGDIDIVCGKKGIATTSDSELHDRHIRIMDGTIKITSLDTVDNDSTGYGLRSAGNLYIEGGLITIDTQKKGISAGKSISTSAGTGEGDDDDDNDDDDAVYDPKELYIWGGEITCTGTVRPETNLGTQNCLYYVANSNFTRNNTFRLFSSEAADPLLTLNNSYRIRKLFFSSEKIETGGSYRIVQGFTALHFFNNISETFTSYSR